LWRIVFVPRSRVFIEELIADAQADYQNSGLKSAKQVESRWRNHLSEFFARRRASEITSDHLQKYVNARRTEGAEPATINRELSLLRRAFHLGRRQTPPKVTVVPFFPMLREAEPRKGFLKPSEYDALARACGETGLWLRAIFEIAVSFGFRRGELVGTNGLKVEQIDFVGNVIRLEVTKNGDPREIYMTETVRSLLMQCVVGKNSTDYVFSRPNGEPVISFRRSWEAACISAGVGELRCRDCDEIVDDDRHCGVCGRDFGADEVRYQGLLVHDLRRTAVRTLVRAGVPDTVCQVISGHRSRSVWDRYNITSQSDLRDAARKLELHRPERPSRWTRHP